MGELDKQVKTSPERDEHGRLLPGQQSLNPAGRPKGKTIKELVREHLDTHPEDMEEFVRHFIKRNRELAWRMMEGQPKQTSDVKVETPIPIANVSRDDSVPETTEATETD